MDNPLLQGGPLTITAAEENAERQELVQRDLPSLVQLRRAEADSRRELQQLAARELNLDAVEQLNQRIAGLVALASDPELAERVVDGISKAKDYNEFVKGVASLADLRDKLLDRSVDETNQGGKKKRIMAHFQGQGVKMVVGVETEG